MFFFCFFVIVVFISALINTTSVLSAGRQGPCRPVFKKNARLMGRLGSGPRLVADRADVVCTHVRLYLLFQLLYLTAIRPLGRKDVHKLTD